MTTNPITTKGDPTMPDNDNAVTQAEIAAVTIAGLPALVKRMCKNGSEPDPKDEAPDATS
jgi:hypothetical protein